MALTIVSAVAIALFLFGSPIVLVMAVWVLGTSYWVVDYPLANVGLSALDSLKNFAFLAVPLFVATGDFLTAGGMSQKLIGLSKSLVSFLPGRTAATTMLASGLFSAVSGSNAATAATMGQLLGPEMNRLGIKPAMSGAIVAAGGTLGAVIPPSTIFIIYGVTLGVSTVDLNLGGMLPGIIMMMFLVFWGAYLTRREEPAETGSAIGYVRNLGRATFEATLGLIAIAILFFGLYLGWFSSTEAAGVATIFCLLAGLFITREIKFRNVPAILQASAAITGIIAPLVAFSLQFQQILSVMQIPDVIQGFLAQIAGNHGQFFTLMVMMLMILIAGCITESVAVVLILAPILAPVAAQLQIHPVHWGVIFVFGTSVGFVTPPYGLNLFVTSAVMNIPYGHLVRSILVFIVPLVISWVIVALVPWFTMVFVTTP